MLGHLRSNQAQPLSFVLRLGLNSQGPCRAASRDQRRCMDARRLIGHKPVRAALFEAASDQELANHEG
jgi:hypothetical protein